MRQPWLPKEKITLSVPAVIGSCEGIDSGFIVFLGENELTLECHTWGEVNVPASYREQLVKISTPEINKADLR